MNFRFLVFRYFICFVGELALTASLVGCTDNEGPTTTDSSTGTAGPTTGTGTTTDGTTTDEPTAGPTTDGPTTAGPTTGTTVEDGTSTTSGEPKIDKRVFVTSEIFHGNLKSQGAGTDGIAGADLLCQGAADQAGLGGMWVAWVSSSSVDAISRLATDGRWTLLDGTTEVFAAYTEIQFGPAHAIDMTEAGASLLPSQEPVVVWTNTDSLGRNADDGLLDACDDWTGQTGTAAVGVLFDPDGGGGMGLSWTDTKQPRGCGDEVHLYCFER